MPQLTVIAKVKVKPEAEATVYQEFQKLIPATLAEEGCLNYDLHRSIEDRTLFWFYENWTSKSIWEQHMESEHIQAFQKATEGMIEDFRLFLMQPEQLAN
ncbi:MAG: putative quinol monooxygenase [Microcoleaceae cyanobacterium]